VRLRHVVLGLTSPACLGAESRRVSPTSTRDAFQVFGLPRTLDLDEKALEQRYLRLSRECHPDHNRAQATADCVAVLQRSAEINDAWRVLREPWRRARALVEAERPGVLDRNKKLDPAFLADALELAEEVAHCTQDGAPALRDRLTTTLAADYEAVRAHVSRADFDAAARRIHMAHYHQKALQDLEARS
jgi:molecular chaperone HscB